MLKHENARFLHINTYLWKLWFRFKFQYCNEIYQKQDQLNFIYEILLVLHENWLLLWRGHSFIHINFITFKRSNLYHYNVLKCNLCFIKKISEKFKSHFKDNFSLKTFAMLRRGHLLFFLDLKTNHNYRFMKEITLLNYSPVCKFEHKGP